MFKINGEKWRVLLVSPYHPMLERSDKTFALGSCSDINKTIYISDDLTNEEVKKVLCHEIAHSAMFSYNVILTLEQEELLADLIATYGQEIIYITNQIFNRIK
jgi:uncharacterized protein YjaZ